MHPIRALLASLLLIPAPAFAGQAVRVWVPPPLPQAPVPAPKLVVHVDVRLIRIAPAAPCPSLYAQGERWPGYIGDSLRRKPY